MSLTTCADCGREISSLAPSCIHCGRPAQRDTVPADAPAHALVVATAACPLCGAAVTHPSARTGGKAWCERCGSQLIYGTDGALVRVLPREAEQRVVAPVVVLGNEKSVGVAMLLAFFFGPLGMFYSTVNGALIMMLVSFFAMIATFGLGIFITWPICVIWAASAASEHNRRLAYGARVAV
jgi:uncharacterized paraquat-inducible protein A